MHKNIIIKPWATQSIQNYITRYGFYYQDLYEDSGLWNEDMIISWYIDEARNRYHEIHDIISTTLQNNIIVYLDNIAIIKWRSKMLQVQFVDEWNDRIVLSINIS